MRYLATEVKMVKIDVGTPLHIAASQVKESHNSEAHFLWKKLGFGFDVL